MSASQPVLFLGHGSPMLAITDSPWRRTWQALGQQLLAHARPQAILCVSAHWERPEPAICSADPPSTLHDFGGFPAELYAQQYPAPGAPDLVAAVQALAPQVQARADWGLDHGAWCLLQALFPAADVPVAQLALARSLDAPGHLALARQLAPLRERGVLLLASGNIVHNLRALHAGPPDDWAIGFDAFVAEALQARDEATLLNPFQRDAATARRAIPTPEHYLPLLYAYGFSRADDPLAFCNTGIDLGSIAMRGAVWGLPTESLPLRPHA